MQPQAGPPANRLLRDARRGHQGLLGGPRLHGSLLFVWPGHGPGWPGRGSRFPPGSFLVRVCPTLLRQILFKLTILLKCPSSACRLDSSPRRQKPSGERALSFLPPRTPSFLPLSSGWGGKGYFPGSSKAPFLLPPCGDFPVSKKARRDTTCPSAPRFPLAPTRSFLQRHQHLQNTETSVREQGKDSRTNKHRAKGKRKERWSQEGSCRGSLSVARNVSLQTHQVRRLVPSVGPALGI